MAGHLPTLQYCPECGHAQITARIQMELRNRRWHIRDPWAVQKYVASLALEPREWVIVLFIGDQFDLLSVETIAVGSETSADVEFRDIICRGLAVQATAMVLVHNHPSGVAASSYADRRLTSDLRRVGLIMGIQLLDSLIVAGDQIVRIGDNASDDTLSPLAL